MRHPFEGYHCESDICHFGSGGSSKITPGSSFNFCLKLIFLILELLFILKEVVHAAFRGRDESRLKHFKFFIVNY